MARAITSDELTKLRGAGQWSELYLAIESPAVVFAARVNDELETTDQIAQITYDTVTTGAYTDILPGMTVLIGSAAGLDDLGQCRVRKAPTSTILYLGEMSEIAWVDNLYITVVDEFGLWARHLTISGSTPRMDYDVAYTDQHLTKDPTPVMGPDAVLWLTGATVVFSPTAAGSWALGSTVTGYSWTAPGASATANLTTATPTITYNAPGQYRVGCTVTAANGKTTTGYRKVFVYSAASAASMPIVPTLESCAGDWEGGGWSFTVTVYASASIRDRAKCILFARDHYGTSTASIGPIAGYENIVASGWIDGESIQYDSQSGTAKFTVHGPAYWLGKIGGFPSGVKSVDATPTGWLFYDSLTVDAGLWHFLHWRSTATIIMDITLTGDTRLISATEAPAGSLWQQLVAMAEGTILAHPVCDRYGRLFIQIDSQYMATGARSAIPTVQAIASTDWRGDEGIQIDRRVVPDVSLLEVSGVSFDGAMATPIISRAPGNVFRRFGRNEVLDHLLFYDQADANATSALVLAQMNNAYPSVAIPLAMNNRMIDIAPLQYITLSVAAGDTPRGITWTNQKLIPRRVSFGHDTSSGALLADIEGEAETSGALSVTVIPPVQPTAPSTDPVIPPLGGFPPFPGGGTDFPDLPPVDPDDPIYACTTDAPANGPYPISIIGLFDGLVQHAPAEIDCVIRSSSHANKSSYVMVGRFYKWDGATYVETNDDGFYDIEAIDSDGVPILTAVHDAVVGTGRQRTGYFSPPSSTLIAGIRLTVLGSSAGILDHVEWWEGSHSGDTIQPIDRDVPWTFTSTGYRVALNNQHTVGGGYYGRITRIIFVGLDHITLTTRIDTLLVTSPNSDIGILNWGSNEVIFEPFDYLNADTIYDDGQNKPYDPVVSAASIYDWGAGPFSTTAGYTSPAEYSFQFDFNSTIANNMPAASWTIDITVEAQPLYRIQVSSMNLYNICAV